MTRQHQTSVASACLLLLLTACPKPLPTVMVDGKAVPYNQAATERWNAVQQAAPAQTPTQLIKSYEDFIHEFPRSEYADDAGFLLGRTFEKVGQPARALEAYERSFSAFKGDREGAARYRYAIVAYQQARPEAVVSALSPIAMQLKGNPKATSAWALLAEGLAATGRVSDAAFYWLRLARDTQDDDLADWLRARAKDAIEAEDDGQVVSAFAAEFDADPLTPWILCRLAEVRYAEGRRPAAESLAKKVLETYPGHDAAARARSILGRVDAASDTAVRTIGVVLPLSGDMAGFGQKALQAVYLGAGVFGGKAKSQEFRLAVRDSKGDPAVAARAVEELFVDENAIAIVGGLLTEEAEAAAHKAQELKIPIITLAQKAGLFAVGDYVFQNTVTAEMQAKSVAHFAWEKLGARSFAILHPESPAGVALAHAFWSEVTALGGRVTAIEHYAASEKDFHNHVEKLVGSHPDFISARRSEYEALRRAQRERDKDKDPKKRKEVELPPVVDFDAVFLPDDYRGAMQAIGFFALADVGIGKFRPARKSPTDPEPKRVVPLGIRSWNHPELPQRGGLYVEGAYFVDAFYPENQDPHVKSFVKGFVDNFLRSPDVLDALAYDSTALLVGSLTRGATTRQKVQARLASLKDWRGTAGALSFTPEGEPQRPLSILTVEDKQIVPVVKDPGLIAPKDDSEG